MPRMYGVLSYRLLPKGQNGSRSVDRNLLWNSIDFYTNPTQSHTQKTHPCNIGDDMSGLEFAYKMAGRPYGWVLGCVDF